MTDNPAAHSVQQALAELEGGDHDMALAVLENLPPALDGCERNSAIGMVNLAAGRYAAALSALRLCVSLGDRTPGMLLNLALAEDHAGDPARAAQIIRVLCDIFPEWDEPPLREAERLRRLGVGSEAEAAYQRALDINAHRPEALIGLSMLLLARNEAAAAQMLLLRCCATTPERAEAWDALGMTLMLTGDARAATSAFAEAQQRAPSDPDIAFRLVQAANASDQSEQELARLEQASRHEPLNSTLLLARSLLLEHLDRAAEAIDLLEAATSLAPGAPAPASALAHALVRANRVPEALGALQRALALTADDVTLRNNLAACLVRMQRFAEARDMLDRLISEHGEQPGFLANLVNAQISLGLHDAALQTARKLTEGYPQMSLAWRSLCNALPYCPGVGGAELLAANRQAGLALAPAAGEGLRNTAIRGRRLRLGLLSSTLKTHPVGWLTVAGFEALDPGSFDLVCIGPKTPDPLQRRFEAIASAWHGVDRIDPATQIRALEIDILIDLGGYGDQGMMRLCVDRLAPVQIKWVGSQSQSTGLPNIDWFVSDGWETPAECEKFYSENLLILPDGYVCYSPPAYAPDVETLPALRRGAVTFGCFNNLAKINETVIACWAGIMDRICGSRLILKCHQFADAPTCQRLLDGFAVRGITPDRITLRASSPHRDLLAQYADIDIVLDPFPYSGGLTTCEALWMGVPTITMPGESFASRHSTSHMSNVGLQDWVAPDRAAYQDMAVLRAGDLGALAELRGGLRSRMAASPLCDGPRFGRAFGSALRRTWHHWCDGR